MSLRERTMLGLRWSAIQNWGSQFGSLLVFLVLARLLAPEAFGLLAFANVLLSFLLLGVDLGLGVALVQRQTLEPGHRSSAFWLQVTSGAALMVVCIAAAGPVAAALAQPELAGVLRGLSLVLVVSALGGVPAALLRREFAFHVMAAASVVGILASAVVAIGLALRGFGVWSLVGQQLTYEAVYVAVLWVGCGWRPRFAASRRHLLELFRFGRYVSAFQILRLMSKRADHFLVGFFLGEVALGYYSVAHRVLQVMTQLLVVTIKQVTLPTLARLQTDPRRLREVLTRGSGLAGLVGFPIFLGTAAVAPELIPLMFGSQWLPAIPLIQVLAMAGVVASINALLENVLLATGRPAVRLRLGAINAAITLVACGVATRWGVLAVAVAYVSSQVVMLPLVHRAAARAAHADGTGSLRSAAVPLVAATCMAGLVLAGRPLLEPALGPGAFLALSVAAGAAFYAVLLRLAAPRLFGDFRELVRIATRSTG